MSRKIVCEKCGVLKPMHPEDVAMGFHQRRVVIDRCVKPADLSVNIYENGQLTNVSHLASLMCDNCGTKIPDGQSVVAITMWRDEAEPDPWEHEYGAT